MTGLTGLIQDLSKLWARYGDSYLRGIRATLILALIATAAGCVIGFLAGVLNTIPLRPATARSAAFSCG